MDKRDLINKFHSELPKLPIDLRAEVTLSLAMQKGLTADDFLVDCIKRFTREYSRDVVSIEQKEVQGKPNFLQIHLSRTGIYDQLPEGLFFQAADSSLQSTVPEQAADYKRNKQKETDIRKFFAPIENDFILQRVQIEREEALLLEGLQSGILHDYFTSFWDLPQDIPQELLAPLILLLPYANRIAGDNNLTAQSLSFILKEKVSISVRSSTITEVDDLTPTLGDNILGNDSVLGSNFLEDWPFLLVEVGPLEGSTVEDYLASGKRKLLMDTFARFFIPAGIDAKIEILVKPFKRNMKLSLADGAILGYSSFLQ